MGEMKCLINITILFDPEKTILKPRFCCLCSHKRGIDPRVWTKDDTWLLNMTSCSVSTKFAAYPEWSIPLVLYLIPVLMQDLLEIKPKHIISFFHRVYITLITIISGGGKEYDFLF